MYINGFQRCKVEEVLQPRASLELYGTIFNGQHETGMQSKIPQLTQHIGEP